MSEKEMPSLKSILRLCIYISILPLKTPAETGKKIEIICRIGDVYKKKSSSFGCSSFNINIAAQMGLGCVLEGLYLRPAHHLMNKFCISLRLIHGFLHD